MALDLIALDKPEMVIIITNPFDKFWNRLERLARNSIVAQDSMLWIATKHRLIGECYLTENFIVNNWGTTSFCVYKVKPLDGDSQKGNRKIPKKIKNGKKCNCCLSVVRNVVLERQKCDVGNVDT